ncbi:NUDIX hydrolase [Geopsychrobacter electrodiphilus]|uniref:NUDIX hydrolase n=1 Tax=Geopsychrobacter electrodiphilus TaxID=225196 RepID=UPI0003788E68|nr:NUDIX hydrolase [Geopsychrobacter electrodiphilus]
MSLLSEEIIFNGRILDLARETHRLPNGREARFEIIHHPGGAAALPIDPDGRLLLIRQFRPAARGTILEIPAGRLEPGEDPATCIVRELQEEVGRKAGRVELLSKIYSTVGFCQEIIHIYLATELTPTPTAREEHEFIELLPLTAAEAFALVDSGQISDAKTLIALQAYRQRLTEGA